MYIIIIYMDYAYSKTANGDQMNHDHFVVCHYSLHLHPLY